MRKTHCHELIWVFEVLLSGENFYMLLNHEACSAQSRKCCYAHMLLGGAKCQAPRIGNMHVVSLTLDDKVN
jgi:hypothetical protein